MWGRLAALAICVAQAQASHAQEFGTLDDLLIGTLSQSGTAVASYFLPNSADLTAATLAVGFVYEPIPGAAGNIDIAVAAFVKGEDSWQFAGPIQGIFGLEPRDPAFGQGFLDVTTTTLGPGEPRCCPTAQTRWRIDFATMFAQRLN